MNSTVKATRLSSLLDVSLLLAAAIQWFTFIVGSYQRDTVNMAQVVFTSLPLIGLTMARVLAARQEALRRTALRLLVAVSFVL